MPYKPTGRPPGRPRHPEPLTPAEQRVLRHLRDGHSNAEIAERLDISPDAVKYHVSNMLGKLELENREQLAAWREPSGLSRIWGVLSIAGWKLAVGGGVALVAVVAGITFWAMTHDGNDSDDIVSLDSLMTGVLSQGIDGQPANGSSLNPSISDDGRFVAFESDATNLVKGDKNGVRDIFVIDRADGAIRRVSVPPGGGEANGPSHRAAISGDGKWVAFESEASNLVKRDVNGELDRVLALLPEQTKELVMSGQISDPVAGSLGGADVFVVELASLRVELASISTAGQPGNLGSYWPSISRDGRYVVFESVAPNLIGAPPREYPSAGVNPFLASEVLLRDRVGKSTTRVSVALDDKTVATGSGSAVISADGSMVAFTSTRTDLTAAGIPPFQARALYVWSRGSAQLQRVPMPPAPADSDGYLFVTEFGRPAFTADAASVAFSMAADAPKRPNPEGINVSGVYIYSPGDALPHLVPGTEDVGRSTFNVSFTGDSGSLIFQSVENQQPIVAEFDLTMGTNARAFTPAGVNPILPVVSADGEWIVAMHYDEQRRGSAGEPIFQIVVFPR